MLKTTPHSRYVRECEGQPRGADRTSCCEITRLGSSAKRLGQRSNTHLANSNVRCWNRSVRARNSGEVRRVRGMTTEIARAVPSEIPSPSCAPVFPTRNLRTLTRTESPNSVGGFVLNWQLTTGTDSRRRSVTHRQAGEALTSRARVTRCRRRRQPRRALPDSSACHVAHRAIRLGRPLRATRR
jgi:hypothetical protein